MERIPAVILQFMLIVMLLVSGCSGGSGGAAPAAPATPEAKSVSGVAATGAAISGKICLRDALSQELCVDTTDGHYTIDVTGLTPPFMLRASWSENGTAKELYSMVASDGVANISPLTQAIVTQAAAQAPSALYAAPTPAALQSAATNLPSATTRVVNALTPLLQQYVISTDLNPITTPYLVNHTGLDGLLDNTRFTFANNALTVTNSVTGDLLYQAADTDIDHGVSAQMWGSDQGKVAEDPSVAVDASGNAVVVWTQFASNGIANIESRWLYGNRAGARVSDGLTSCVAPKVVFAPDGTAHAVWYQAESSGYSSIRHARYIPGTGWTARNTVSRHPATYAYYPQLAVDGSGNAVAVWYESNPPVGNHFDVYASTYLAQTGAWSTPVQLNNSAHSAYRPMVAVNAGGQAVAVWPEDIGDGSVSNDYKEIVSSRWNGTAWSAPVKLNDIFGTTVDIAAYLTVAVDSNGDALALWSQGSIRGAWLVNGAWSASQIVTQDAPGGCDFPEVVFYSPGKAMAVWRQHNGVDRYDVATSAYAAGSGWSTAVVISRQVVSADIPHLAVDASGTAAVVWVEGMYLATPPAMVEAMYHPGSGWSTPISLALLTDASGMYVPVTAIGANKAGLVYSVWGLDSM